MLYRLSQLILRKFDRKKYPFWILCFSRMGRKNLNFLKFFANSFVFGSTGLDPKFVAFVATR